MQCKVIITIRKYHPAKGANIVDNSKVVARKIIDT